MVDVSLWRGPLFEQSGSQHKKVSRRRMETITLFKGATKMRLFHCSWISAVLILLFLLTTFANLNKSVPAIVSKATGGKPSNEDVTQSDQSKEDVHQIIQEDPEPVLTFEDPSLRATRVDYTVWDSKVGCRKYRRKYPLEISASSWPSSLQKPNEKNCTTLRQQHVAVLVKEFTWFPDNLNNLYQCGCGLTCLWTTTDVLVDRPDAHLYETVSPPATRQKGDPWRVYLDLEAGRHRAASQDLFVSYHADDDVQVTYAGAAFHVIRNYYVSPVKHDDVLVYWSSSRCLGGRQKIATELLELLPHHSFGKCLNNVGGLNLILHMYPKCNTGPGAGSGWSQNLHCAMSHYKFALAIENTQTESYITEKLYYALDVGTIPIYFGAPNVLDFVPPHSIIEGFKFGGMEELAVYVKKVAADPVLYAEYHAWRRCGVIGNYGRTRAVSLDSLPCRLCTAISKRGGREG